MALADLTDATPDTSSDEIKDFAEQVAKEVEADRAGESKSDAQITNEQASTPQPADKPTETPAENNPARPPWKARIPAMTHQKALSG